ncbi:MAG: hypothetical protein SFX73_26375 [Kofleriaceae bacterium]|nr:hypothetical protein [Kofleriaceae bacterium]
MRLLTTLVLMSACATSADPVEDTPPTEDGPSCDAPAGKLTLYVLPPPSPLDWRSPNQLLGSVLESRSTAATKIERGDIVLSHSLGHVNLALDCGEDSIPLTGQTNTSENQLAALTNGAGLLLADLPGTLDHMPDATPVETAADIAARQQSGEVSQISFVVNRATCRRIREFFDDYVWHEAFRHYNGAMRPRRFEGAGCAIFGAGVVDVAGLMRRSLFTPAWSRSVMIGSARIANALRTPTYGYGSNLVALGPDGTHQIWPVGQDVMLPTTAPALWGSDALDAWSGPEDQPWPIQGLSDAMRTQLPFSIYDPQLMGEWVEDVWGKAKAQGVATALGVPWTASTVGTSHEITYDASCITPQSIPFADDNDDLFADSDAR